MSLTIHAERGWVDVRTKRRSDKRWDCECRFVSPNGDCSSWVSAASAEGYVSRDLAFSAGILLGRELAARFTARVESARPRMYQ